MGQLNPIIIDEIKKINCDEKLKEFLIEVLKSEADHLENGERWWFSDKYEKLVKKAIG